MDRRVQTGSLNFVSDLSIFVWLEFIYYKVYFAGNLEDWYFIVIHYFWKMQLRADTFLSYKRW